MDNDRDWAVGTRVVELADDGSILCVSDNGTRRRIQVVGTVEMQRRIRQLESCLAWTIRNMGRIEDAAFYAGTYKQLILDSVEYIRAHNQVVLDNPPEPEPDPWTSIRSNNTHKFTMGDLIKRIAELAAKLEPDYPNIRTVPAWEQLWAIEQGALGREMAIEDWVKHCKALQAEIDLWESECEKESQEHAESGSSGSATPAPVGE